MPFKLNLVAVVYPNSSADSDLNPKLLQKANAWLQRRSSNISDDLLLIGAGFVDESAFQAMLKPYGLAGARIDVVPLDEYDENDGTSLYEYVESTVQSWIFEHHRIAIPVVTWDNLVPDATYQVDGWWWVGLEAENDQQSTLGAILKDLLPDAFKPQALTWATILADYDGLSPDGEEHEAHDAAIKTVGLARWLAGFDAAAENNFYDFSASQAIDTAGLDTLRLGFEAGRSYESELSDYFDGNAETEGSLAAACLMACLRERNEEIHVTLCNAFGGDSLLFWTLYRSIWPDLKQSSYENMEDLIGLRSIDMDVIHRSWQFVNYGWIDFEDE